MKFKANSGGDDWLRQLELRDEEKFFRGYYQNCITHCCGLSALGGPFGGKQATVQEVQDLIDFLQKRRQPIQDANGYGSLFTSPCVLFTVSVENDGDLNNLIAHPQVTKIHEFTNLNGHDVSMYAITLQFPPDEDDDE